MNIEEIKLYFLITLACVRGLFLTSVFKYQSALGVERCFGPFSLANARDMYEDGFVIKAIKGGFCVYTD